MLNLCTFVLWQALWHLSSKNPFFILKKKCQAISYFSEQEYYYLQCLLLLLQRLSIHPSPGQTDHQKFILLHIAFPMYKWTKSALIGVYQVKRPYVSTKCTMHILSWLNHYKKARWRGKTRTEAHLYAVGQRSTHRPYHDVRPYHQMPIQS